MGIKKKNVVVLSYVDKNINSRVGEGAVPCQSFCHENCRQFNEYLHMRLL